MAFKVMNIPSTGDLIRVKREAGYYHFGIAVSEDRVIHFTAVNGDLSRDNRDIRIIETPLADFVRNDTLEIEVPFSSKYSRETVVKRAKKYINSQYFREKGYNFVENNCEHFARYCYDGKADSEQVLTGAMMTVALGAAAIGGVIGAIANRRRNKKKKQIEQNEQSTDLVIK